MSAFKSKALSNVVFLCATWAKYEDDLQCCNCTRFLEAYEGLARGMPQGDKGRLENRKKYSVKSMVFDKAIKKHWLVLLWYDRLLGKALFLP